MKLFYLTLTYLFSLSAYCQVSSSSLWTWKKGSNIQNVVSVYGTQMMSNPVNSPGSRESSASWTDKNGNLWLYGGYGRTGAGFAYFNDLWRYDTRYGWIWMKGDSTTDKYGVYGTQGYGDYNNKPGARYGSATWVDDSGNLWLYGGFGRAETGGFGTLNDLWKFDVYSNSWTWMKGSKILDAAGTYGVKGTPSSGNTPGAKEQARGVTDRFGKLWLFGGEFNGSYYNDLWKYDPVTNQWTWMFGASTRGKTAFMGAWASALQILLPEQDLSA